MAEYYTPKELNNKKQEKKIEIKENETVVNEKLGVIETEKPISENTARQISEEKLIEYHKLDFNGKINYNVTRLLELLKNLDDEGAQDLAVYQVTKNLILNGHNEGNLDVLLGRLEILKHAIIKHNFEEEVDYLE